MKSGAFEIQLETEPHLYHCLVKGYYHALCLMGAMRATQGHGGVEPYA